MGNVSYFFLRNQARKDDDDCDKAKKVLALK